ncbi:hypothetical protein DICA3_A01486 [Diutina catenulata]
MFLRRSCTASGPWIPRLSGPGPVFARLPRTRSHPADATAASTASHRSPGSSLPRRTLSHAATAFPVPLETLDRELAPGGEKAYQEASQRHKTSHERLKTAKNKPEALFSGENGPEVGETAPHDHQTRAKTGLTQPTLRDSPFTSSPPPTLASLASLSPSELQKLVKTHVFAAETTEKHRFLAQIVDTMATSVTEHPATAARLLRALGPHKNALVDPLRARLSRDPVRNSIFEWALDPQSARARRLLFANVYHICRFPAHHPKKAQFLTAFLEKLASTGVTNRLPVELPTKLYRKVMNTAGPARFRQLFATFVALNLQTKDPSQLSWLKKTLDRGSALDSFVGRTGWMHARWHDTPKASFPREHLEKMRFFYSYDDLLYHCVRSRHPAGQNMYLRLLVEKYEHQARVHPAKVPAEAPQHVFTAALATVTESQAARDGNHAHASASEAVVSVLAYMKAKGIPVTFPAWLTVLRRLRSSGQFADALTVVNSISVAELAPAQARALVGEILLLIGQKYPKQPAVLMGYVVAFYPSARSVFADLGLVGMVYDSPGATIPAATVDATLVSAEAVPEAVVANVLETLFRSMSRAEKPPTLALDVWERAKTVVPMASDRVVVALVDDLVRRFPPGGASFVLSRDPTRFSAAKTIALDYFEHFGTARGTTALYDVLVSVGFLHNDYAFAAAALKNAQACHVPSTFNQLWPFINYHYRRGDHAVARLWYDQLAASGAKAVAGPAKELWKIAHELGWPEGKSYRRAVQKSAKTQRNKAHNMAMDPFGHEATEDRVTNELIGDKPSFSHQLASILS